MTTDVVQRWRAHRSLYRPAGEVIDRFNARVRTDGPIPEACPDLGPCWIWTGSLVRGYGQFKLDGRNLKAHRVAWAISRGETPGSSCVLHRCDTPTCVNPAHLFLGTNQENTADKVRKGRCARGPSLQARIREKQPRGTNCPASKLTEQDVTAIRASVAEGRRTLAARFGVTPQAIDKILSGRSWAHVPYPKFSARPAR